MVKILFIANPIAGGKSKARAVSLIGSCLDPSRYEWEVAYTTGPGHATQLAAETDAEVVVAIGGDGTVDEVAKGILGTSKTLGIIPCGSGDGLAFHLHLTRDVKKALSIINDGYTRVIDHAIINGEPFFCTCGVGVDAVVSQKFATGNRRGLPAYIDQTIKTWFQFHPETYTLEMDNCTISAKAMLITVGNANQWGNKVLITPQASLCDGLLDVTILEPMLLAEVPLLAAQLINGTVNRNPRVKSFRCSRIKIIRQSEGAAHYDGEATTLGKEIDIRIVPSALKVIVPKRYQNKI